MSSFVSWVLSILAIIVLGTVLDMFLSEKKLGKIVRSVFASLLVLVIISPLPALLDGCKDFDQNFIPQELTLDEKFLNYANEQKKNALENGLVAALADKGYNGVKADISADFGTEISVKTVRLDLSAVVVENKTQNLNKAQNIRNLAADFLKISKDLVVVYD